MSFAPKDLDPTIKWRRYYEQTNVSKYQHLVPFNTFAKVSRGIATGANDYFVFKRSKLENYNLKENCALPCICHSQDVKTHIFSSEDFLALAKADKCVYLFNACSQEQDLSVRNYLNQGEQQEVHKRYLTASRKPWYAIENRTPSPIWVSVFNRQGLRFVRNEANVYNLTTFHCVYNTGSIETDVLFAYLLTSIAKQIFLDNSRQYGNGLIKFEPNDLNKGMVVDLTLLSERDLYYIKELYKRIKYCSDNTNKFIEQLDFLFETKYTGGKYNIEDLILNLELLPKNEKLERANHKVHSQRVKQLNFSDVLLQYPKRIVENSSIISPQPSCGLKHDVDLTKNVLISYVRADNMEHFIDQSAKIYYTGKRFPSVVALNKLYYFMPYIKRKGIRDLYLIKIARVGTRKEGQPDNDPNDFRLVFEIEFVKQLFTEYKPIELTIWHTFTDTTIKEIVDTYLE